MYSMMKKNILSSICFCMGLMMLLVACGNDDESQEEYLEDGVAVTVFPELESLQNSLVELDSAGNFHRRVLGATLDADTTVLCVGVKDIEEAYVIFEELFAPNTEKSVDNHTFTLGDNQGYATLKVAAIPEDGVLASVDFTTVPNLKYVTALKFIQSEAWPNNAPSRSPFKLNVIYELNGFTASGRGYLNSGSYMDKDKMEKFLCVREYKQGKSGLLVGLSDKAYCIPWRATAAYEGKMVTSEKAREIAEIIKSNFEHYKKLFNADGTTRLSKNWEYWTKSGAEYVFLQNRECVNLSTGGIRSIRDNNVLSVLWIEYFGGKE